MPKLIKDRRNRTKIGLCGTKYFEILSRQIGLLNPFWSFKVEGGLYICLERLPHAIRMFLVVPTSGVVIRPISTQRHLFDSPKFDLHLKLRMYQVVICSLITHGCEAWRLDSRTIRMLNNDNSIMLSRITDNIIGIPTSWSATLHNLVCRPVTLLSVLVFRGEGYCKWYCRGRGEVLQ